MFVTFPQIVLLLIAGAAVGFAIARSYYAILVRATVAECLSNMIAMNVLHSVQAGYKQRTLRYAAQKQQRDQNAILKFRARPAMVEREEIAA